MAGNDKVKIAVLGPPRSHRSAFAFGFCFPDRALEEMDERDYDNFTGLQDSPRTLQVDGKQVQCTVTQYQLGSGMHPNLRFLVQSHARARARR